MATQKRLTEILKITLANLCDVANKQPINTEYLMELYRELDKE